MGECLLLQIAFYHREWLVYIRRGSSESSQNRSPDLPQPPCCSFIPSCCFWIVNFPAWLWFLFQKHQDCAVFGFGLFCLKLTGTFEASQPLGNSVAPLWDTRSVTEGKQGGFYNVSSFLLPILSSKQMASRLLWFFRGGERMGGWYKELKRAEKHAQPLTPPYS